MKFAGQPFDFADRRSHRGYAMAALLVGMSVMAVLLTALMPVWTHMATREKEEELIFRGKQYARAIGLFQRKFANTPPPSIDVLVEQRFLRKKYKDPITNDDFQPLYANAQPGASGAPQSAQRPGQQAAARPSTSTQTVQSGFASTGMGPQGGIIGVTSKSKDASIKIYNGRQHYNEWAFVYVQTAQQAGQGGASSQRPGQQGPGQQPGPFGMPRGGPGQGPGQQSFPPGAGPRPPFGPPGQIPNPGVTPPGQRRPPGQ